MAFFVWAIACVLVSKAYGARHHNTEMEELNVENTPKEPAPSSEELLLDGAWHGNLKKVEWALEEGAQVDAVTENGGRTALFFTSNLGYVKVAEKLLAAGADIEKPSGCSQTALNSAAGSRQLEMVQLLLDHNASVESANCYGRTPLIEAVLTNYAEVVKLLLKKNANASYITSEGRNALHFASTPEIIEMLLEKHVNVNQIDEDGESPLLHKLGEAGRKLLRNQVVKLLLDAGADPNVKSKRGSRTPLHYAASYGLVEIVKMLLAKKADVNARNSEGETPLDWVKNLYSAPYGRQKFYGNPRGDPKEVEKILIDAGGFQKYSWASMKDRVKSAFGRKPRQSI